jgi:cytochrome P450
VTERAASFDDFKLLSSEVLTEPYEYWRMLRRTAPVHTVDEGIGYTIVTRYEDVVAALRDSESFSNHLGRRFPSGMSAYIDSPAVKEVLRQGCPYVDVLSFSDGDVHARHRRIGRRPFTSRHVRELDDIIVATVDDLTAALPRGVEVDLVTRFCIPLPITVIAHILGVDPSRADDVKRWADAQVARLGEPLDDEADNLRLARDLVDMHQYLFAQIRDRRKNPGEDFLSDLVNSGESYTDEELVMIGAQLIVGGAETSASLIASMIDLLLDQPEAMQRSRDDPGTIPDIVEETLRVESPIKLVHRIAMRDVELGGTLIKKDSVVLLMLGSANRDERFARQPGRFDPARADGRKHVAFGQGIHMCLGAALARAEGRLALAGLLKATRSVERARPGKPEHRSSLTVRGVTSLPVIIDAGG